MVAFGNIKIITPFIKVRVPMIVINISRPELHDELNARITAPIVTDIKPNSHKIAGLFIDSSTKERATFLFATNDIPSMKKTNPKI